MLPRRKLDIGWLDLIYGIISCFWPGSREVAQDRVEAFWSSESESLVCLSIRSGFDLLLQALELPPGSEILVSAVTIRDMTRIIEHHGLVSVPIDLHMETLSVKAECLARAVSPRTKAIVVAHLFGSRMPLEEVLTCARQHGLLVVEDCAQAYASDQYRGHPNSDICMFSFGPIKTDTALGGGILRFRDRSLLSQVRTLQTRYPIQGRWRYLNRVTKYVLLKLLSYLLIFSIFTALTHLLRKSHDAIINAAVRGFVGPDFFTNIRQQPSYPLLAMLERRLRNSDRAKIELRKSVAEKAIALMPRVKRPGAAAPDHTHWVFPIQVASPDELMGLLWRKGFDATRGASSLYVVDPPIDRPEMTPMEARQAMEQALFLPVYPGVSVSDLKRLADAVTNFEAN